MSKIIRALVCGHDDDQRTLAVSESLEKMKMYIESTHAEITTLFEQWLTNRDYNLLRERESQYYKMYPLHSKQYIYSYTFHCMLLLRRVVRDVEEDRVDIKDAVKELDELLKDDYRIELIICVD